MVLIFDLDDTLYPEIEFVHSGFEAVSVWGREQFGWDPQESFEILSSLLQRNGRGRVFDEWLKRKGVNPTRAIVNCALQTYRYHPPAISLPESTRRVLTRTSATDALYLVTDGNRLVQRNKISALELREFFSKIFITRDYGIEREKPSLFCFEKIRKLHQAKWEDMVYVGDNPEKDFVSLNIVGARTVRVLTGAFRDSATKPGFDAQITAPSLADAVDLLT